MQYLARKSGSQLRGVVRSRRAQQGCWAASLAGLLLLCSPLKFELEQHCLRDTSVCDL